MYKKIRHGSLRRSPAITDGNNAKNQLEFHFKEIKWKASNKAVTSKRNDEVCTHICSTKWAILLKLRYVSCKVWDKVVCCANSNSCTVRIHFALLSRLNAASQRGTGNVDIGFSALGRDTWHPKSTLHWLNELATVSVSVTTVSERSVSPKILKEVNHERKHCSFSGHHDYACPAYWHLSGSYVS